MSVLVPGATPAQQAATIADLRRRLDLVVAEIELKFAGRTFVASEMQGEIDRAFVIATERQRIAEDMSSSAMPADRLQEIGDICLDLLELKGFFDATASGAMASNGYPPMYVFDYRDTYWQKALALEKAPIVWVRDAVIPVLTDFSEMDKALDAVANIPQAGIKWTLEQILKALGLPTWLLPVIGVTAITGVGAWAYFSFLAPVGSASRALRLRHNPKRQRRVIRRRRRS